MGSLQQQTTFVFDSLYRQRPWSIEGLDLNMPCKAVHVEFNESGEEGATHSSNPFYIPPLPPLSLSHVNSEWAILSHIGQRVETAVLLSNNPASCAISGTPPIARSNSQGSIDTYIRPDCPSRTGNGGACKPKIENSQGSERSTSIEQHVPFVPVCILPTLTSHYPPPPFLKVMQYTVYPYDTLGEGGGGWRWCQYFWGGGGEGGGGCVT